MSRKIQFCHDRNLDSKGNLSPKGGLTIALEELTKEEFKALKPSLTEPITLKIGLARCSKKDNYNKKIGRTIAEGRLVEVKLYPSSISSREVQLHNSTIGTVFLRCSENSERIYFVNFIESSL